MDGIEPLLVLVEQKFAPKKQEARMDPDKQLRGTNFAVTTNQLSRWCHQCSDSAAATPSIPVDTAAIVLTPAQPRQHCYNASIAVSGRSL
jgi:hypothetical protein